MKTINENKTARLPCRGCTRSCKNYERCDGKPWRLAVDDVVSSGNADKAARG